MDNQGDVIGIMGNTGRVYDATGIHTHWEVMVNGVKVKLQIIIKSVENFYRF